MTIGFAIATKYRLRRQWGYEYPDLVPYIQNLDTFARRAYINDGPLQEEHWSPLRRVAVDFGIPGARPDPCARTCKGTKYHGNLPVEILEYLSAYIEILLSSGRMPSIPVQIQVTECTRVIYGLCYWNGKGFGDTVTVGISNCNQSNFMDLYPCSSISIGHLSRLGCDPWNLGYLTFKIRLI